MLLSKVYEKKKWLDQRSWLQIETKTTLNSKVWNTWVYHPLKAIKYVDIQELKEFKDSLVLKFDQLAPVVAKY